MFVNKETTYLLTYLPSVYARPVLGSVKQTMLTHKVLARHSEGPP